MSRNAIILAAGTSSRFIPLSYERPKGLLEVHGEILIERQIRQLREAGVSDIYVVVGYHAEMFAYLESRYGVHLVYNEDYAKYNNTSSMIRVMDVLSNSFICSSDNYFPNNVFKTETCYSYYAAKYADGETNEYCMITDSDDNILKVTIGGKNAWYMIGHVFFNVEYSSTFRALLKKEYEKEETRHRYWEDVYIENISTLPMKIRRYQDDDIQEFDSLDELRTFDRSYISNTRSNVVKEIANTLDCNEEQLHAFKPIKDHHEHHFSFMKGDALYEYIEKNIKKI